MSFLRRMAGLNLRDRVGMSWFPPGGVGRSGRGEDHPELHSQAVASATRTLISGRKQNETKRVMIINVGANDFVLIERSQALRAGNGLITL